MSQVVGAGGPLQGRGIGVVEGLRAVLPPWAVEGFAALTHLGDVAVLLALATLIYLGYGRRAGGFVAGALFTAFAVTIAAKAWFASPRPPSELQHVTATGLGFPSGHAIGAAVGWGAAATALERVSTLRRRAAVAAVVVVAVAVSRVAIGVHYLVDVVAGLGVGLAVLAAAVRWGRDEPRPLFGLAAVVALVAAVVSGGSNTAYAVLGGSIGAVAAWPVAVPSEPNGGREDVALTAVVGGMLAGALAVVYPDGMLAYVTGGVATAAVLLGPVARDRWLGPVGEEPKG